MFFGLNSLENCKNRPDYQNIYQIFGQKSREFDWIPL